MGSAKMLRMPADLEEQIRKFQERFRKETGVEIKFSAAIRLLVQKGLAGP